MEESPMRETWETRHAAKLLGTNPRRLMGFVEKELITPTAASEGKGSRRQFSLADITRLAIYMAVQNIVGEKSPFARWTVEALAPAVAEIAQQLVTGDIKPPAANTLFIEIDVEAAGERVDVWYGADDDHAEVIRNAMSAGNPVVVVPLADILTIVRERLEEMESEKLTKRTRTKKHERR
jgi:hypothetical protein